MLDPGNDLAILKVHPPRSRASAGGAAAGGSGGNRAGGHPGHGVRLATQPDLPDDAGHCLKVEPGALLGDFLIQPGNSGGPLVNLAGQVIGINTFLAEGISGAVRVNRVREALAHPAVVSFEGRSRMRRCCQCRRGSLPTELLKEKILSEPFNASTYVLDGGRFTVTAITPVFIGKIQVQADLQQAANRYKRRAKKIKDGNFNPADEPFYDWHRNATSWLDSVVTFEVKPDFGQTKGSMWASALTAVSAGLSGTPVRPTRQTMEFKAEFQELRLYRDGELVIPITPGRQITEQSVSGPFMHFVDEAYSGMYQYAADVFLTGRQYRLDIVDAREPEKVHKSIALAESHKLIQEIRKDFEGVALR
ncbi:MAG: hypothetical protein R2712_12440 [Vicinamibacterales bacterium]